MTPCPACGGSAVAPVYRAGPVPVHCGLLMPTREMAVGYPTGEIRLGFCRCCGFLYNMAFDPAAVEYSQNYDETQTFSPTFNAFHRGLAERLIARFGLRGRDILEIGCGKGEFLAMLCEMGGNRGWGFDPSYTPGRLEIPAGCRVEFIQDFYSEKYADYRADFFCCNMTLEHIAAPGTFVRTIHSAMSGSPEATVFFLLPDAGSALRKGAFWDIYYEHCSYFTRASLEGLFRRCGFEVLALENEYSGQYLSIAARRASGGRAEAPGAEMEAPPVRLGESIAHWRRVMARLREQGRRTVLWGGGSKAVAFLTTLGLGDDEIRYVADINPHRQGTWLAGSGQRIVAPEFLPEYRPDAVLIMNPVYHEEICAQLARMGLAPQVLSLS